MQVANVVLPRPGGPSRRMWPRGSERMRVRRAELTSWVVVRWRRCLRPLRLTSASSAIGTNRRRAIEPTEVTVSPRSSVVDGASVKGRCPTKVYGSVFCTTVK